MAMMMPACYTGGMNDETHRFPPEDPWDEEAELRRAQADLDAGRTDRLYLHGLPILTPAEEEESLRRADEDIAAGRVVPHEEVAKWLRTWGTPDEKPMPREWLR